MTDIPSTEPLRKAIEAAGGQTKLAEALRTSQGRIWNWLNRDKRVPAEFVLKIERVTGVSRHELRPDLYPEDDNSIATSHAA